MQGNIKNITKLLKANELSIEIKNLTENATDLTELFKLILLRISEVIPNAKRGCVLRVDSNDYLYMVTSVGYSEGYAKEFRIPFLDSFANAYLDNNYNRSVVINDIQEKLRIDFPDIVVPKRGFVLESNMAAPICLDGKIYGLLSIDSDENNAFDEVDLNLVDYLRIQLERSINSHSKLIRVVEDSRRDVLTGAYNRRYLSDRFKKYIDARNSLDEIFSFVVFDIDGLKRINDELGHLTGDMVLKQFASLVLNEIRDEDIFARFGGDEFVGLFLKSREKDLMIKIDRWQLYLKENKIEIENKKVSVEFSYGIAEYPEDGVDFEALMAVADKYMYKNKKFKKSRI